MQGPDRIHEISSVGTKTVYDGKDFWNNWAISFDRWVKEWRVDCEVGENEKDTMSSRERVDSKGDWSGKWGWWRGC